MGGLQSQEGRVSFHNDTTSLCLCTSCLMTRIRNEDLDTLEPNLKSQILSAAWSRIPQPDRDAIPLDGVVEYWRTHPPYFVRQSEQNGATRSRSSGGYRRSQTTPVYFNEERNISLPRSYSDSFRPSSVVRSAPWTHDLASSLGYNLSASPSQRSIPTNLAQQHPMYVPSSPSSLPSSASTRRSVSLSSSDRSSSGVHFHHVLPNSSDGGSVPIISSQRSPVIPPADITSSLASLAAVGAALKAQLSISSREAPSSRNLTPPPAPSLWDPLNLYGPPTRNRRPATAHALRRTPAPFSSILSRPSSRIGAGHNTPSSSSIQPGTSSRDRETISTPQYSATDAIPQPTSPMFTPATPASYPELFPLPPIPHELLAVPNIESAVQLVGERASRSGRKMGAALMESVQELLNELSIFLHRNPYTQRGLTDEQINSIPCRPYSAKQEVQSEPNKCFICMKKLEENKVISLLPCTHFCHKECADIWLRRERSCPVCRCDALTGEPQPTSSS